MINQSLSNITQSGSEQHIDVNAGGVSITPHQAYFLFTGFFITLIILILCIKEIIIKISDKACIGCKRLKKCEKAIQEIKKEQSVRGFFDNKTFNHILAELEKIKEWFKNNGADNIK